MAVIVQKVKVLKCNDCGYEWKPRKKRGKYQGALPPMCARCKSTHWNSMRLAQTQRRRGDNRISATEQRSSVAL